VADTHSSAQVLRRASFNLLISATLFGLMALGARLISARIPGSQMAFVRFASGVVTVFIAWSRFDVVLQPTRWGWLFVRGTAGGLAVLCYYVSIARIGAGFATLLNYTSPVFSLICAWILLGERPRRDAIVALVLTLSGVAMVVGFDNANAGAWAFVAMASAVLSGVAVTAIRAARQPSADGRPAENAWTVFASFTTLGTLATIPSTFGPFGHWVAPTSYEWLVLFFVVLSSIVAQLVMTSALGYVTVVGSGIIHQLTPLIALAGGVVLLGETVSRLAAIGCLVTLSGVGWTVLATGRIPRSVKADRDSPLEHPRAQS